MGSGIKGIFVIIMTDMKLINMKLISRCLIFIGIFVIGYNIKGDLLSQLESVVGLLMMISGFVMGESYD